MSSAPDPSSAQEPGQEPAPEAVSRPVPKPVPEPAGEPAKRQNPLGARPRDMVISLLLLLPLVGFMALLGRSCSFSPTGPTVDPNGPAARAQVNPHPPLGAAARRVSFPVREPATPAGWRVTSVDQRPGPGGAGAVRVSWLTGGGKYLRLVQTAAGTDEGALVTEETAGPPRGPAAPITSAGGQWVGYPGGNGEPAWTRTAEGARWLITGSGTPEEFQALASAVTAAAPLPRTG